MPLVVFNDQYVVFNGKYVRFGAVAPADYPSDVVVLELPIVFEAMSLPAADNNVDCKDFVFDAGMLFGFETEENQDVTANEEANESTMVLAPHHNELDPKIHRATETSVTPVRASEQNNRFSRHTIVGTPQTFRFRLQ